jgi:hypothetical protein
MGEGREWLLPCKPLPCIVDAESALFCFVWTAPPTATTALTCSCQRKEGTSSVVGYGISQELNAALQLYAAECFIAWHKS